ncbi:MAG: hypothetical protein H6667_23165 [Ardenticatenaceae bacterium]|nr:hypothetical protein [Ardenticatenaceae bacterium]MCB9446234.1 hypothetical protein [Ardenticatenaceae bacterium]
MKSKLWAFFWAAITPLLLWQFIGLIRVANADPAAAFDVCSGGCTYSTLGAAAAVVPEGSVINLQAGIYSENLVITKSLTIQGQGAGVTIIDGGSLGTAVLIDDFVAVTITNVTIQNGRSPDGGGISNPYGLLTLGDSVIQNNDALCGEGGGLLNLGTAVLQNVIITGNQAAYGGGISNDELLLGTNITVTHNSAVDNSCEGITGYGGGIDNSGTVSLTAAFLGENTAVNDGGAVENAGTFTITLSLLENNQSQTKGGGLDNVTNSQTVIRQSSIRLNEADLGGGLNNEGAMQLIQSAVYSNTAVFSGSSGGGGLRNETGGSLLVTNSTISGNMAGEGGGLLNVGAKSTAVLHSSTFVNNFGVHYGGIYNINGAVTFANTIIAGQQNGVDCGGGLMTSANHNMDSDGSCLLRGVGDFSRVSQPFLGPLQDNGGPTWTHALMIGSPAIDASPVCEPVDQRGVNRPTGTACDIGSYETFAFRTYVPVVVR